MKGNSYIAKQKFRYTYNTKNYYNYINEKYY